MSSPDRPTYLAAEISNLTQIERDHVIEWLRVNRPVDLRTALRQLGYMALPGWKQDDEQP